jgi:2-keto-3-deoxy-L-rhamnonate aldolase RhmA
VQRAVAACRYPPEGVRGFGPRRPAEYGAKGGPEFCQLANRTIVTIVQIEQHEALTNLDAILKVTGLASVVVGPNDLAASLGYTGQPGHAEVVRAIDTVIAKSRAAGVPMGLAVGDNVESLKRWIDKGVNWLSIAADFALLLSRASQLTTTLRQHQPTKT